MDEGSIILKTINLRKYYEVRSKILKRVKQFVKAVDDVTIEIKRGETLAVVGESGSGKTTLGMVLGKLLEPTDGKILFKNLDITYSLPKNLLGKIRLVFQDPYSALNPRLKIVDSLIEPLQIMNIGRKEAIEKVAHYLQLVGLPESYMSYYPHMLSGGQRQRVVVARALITEPEFLILDEPTSMLDVSTQSQILRLLRSIKKEKQITYLFITHNLVVARYMANRIAVMYAGQIVEIGGKSNIFQNPLHPYTRTLLSAYPSPNPRSQWNPIIPEELTVKYYENKCRYIDRCSLKMQKCEKNMPTDIKVEEDHYVKCFLYAET
ncbi:MAG: ABC transporter ATP-binding protein [Sulfolobales archaeon]|nr:ABC transporter ATP-binding protein [Sulfolobales archaeon]MCX8199516.1 ABC transporter ATP-binding protein [Sulfolobales archaeon]MDW8170469.1 ABC transporter ATP-binding protein [Desulfurococcaceae archaeon]